MNTGNHRRTGEKPKVFENPDTLFRHLDPRDGMRISFHHHLRMGDRVVGFILRALTEAGVKNLTLSVSSIMGPAGEAAARAIRSGTVRRIETTGAKPPLSNMIIRGELEEPVVFRTHGGRARALRQGDIPVDIAFVAASAADREGNLNGTGGPSAFGSLGYGMTDAQYARTVVAVTDGLVDSPLERISIPGDRVHCILTVDSIGDTTAMTGGTLRATEHPVHRIIAGETLELLKAVGAIRNGWAYQAGSGAVSLLVTEMVAEEMRLRSLRGSFASGGITGTLTRLLEEGLFETLWDVQSFDLAAAESLHRNPNHREMSAGLYADPGVPENIAGRLNVMILSATEVDREFNVNSLTGTNGRIIGALGGAPDTAAGSDLTLVVLPAIRGRIPTLHHRVRTVCTPGAHVDAVITERGIAVNPKREDLLRALRDSGHPETLKFLSMDTLIEKIHRITGTPAYPSAEGRTAGIVEAGDGTVLDTIPSLSFPPEDFPLD